MQNYIKVILNIPYKVIEPYTKIEI